MPSAFLPALSELHEEQHAGVGPYKAPDTLNLISILLPDLRVGGAERVMVDLANAFAGRGYSVELVLLAREGSLLSELQGGVTVVNLGVRRTRSAVAPLAAYMRRAKPVALIANMWPLTSIAAAAHLISGRVGRLILADHCPLSKQYAAYGPAHRFALRVSTAVFYRMAHGRVGVSSGVADDLAKLSGIARSRFSVIYNPIPPRGKPSVSAVAQAENAWGAGEGPRILTVGSLKPEKNHDLLLRAFGRLPASMDARLMLLGDGALRQELQVLARALGIADRVLLPGFVSDPTPYYHSAELFALASNYEGFGNVIVEALACGLPVVSTDCPSGPAEILDGERYGRLVPPADEAALADAMAEALRSPADSAFLQSRACDFSVDRAVKAYLNLVFPS